jgi:predicted DNA binding protein
MEYRQVEPYHITIEIENKRCKIMKMLDRLGIQQFEMTDVRSYAPHSTGHLVRMSREQFNKLPKRLIKTQDNSIPEGEASLWLNSSGCDVCNTMLSHEAFLVSGRNVKNYTIVYSFIAPNFNAFKDIISKLESKGLKPKIVEVEKYTPKGKILTKKQESVLWFAYNMGFFDYPRKINSIELSDKLGIGVSTLSEITRRGMHRLLKDHFKS